MQRNVRNLTHGDVFKRTRTLAQIIHHDRKEEPHHYIYPIPRGGVPVAYALRDNLRLHEIYAVVVDDPGVANFFVDDVIDSGKTKKRYQTAYPTKKFYALYDKINNVQDRDWLVFPWEVHETGSAEDICLRLLQFIGEDPDRDGLKDTPKRFIRAWQEWTSGYGVDPKELFTTFEGEGYDQMVLVKDIPFYSHCEHHLAPFFGTVAIAYIPNEITGQIVGLSKLNRLVGVFSKRLQVQERLTSEIAFTLQKILEAKGVGVLVRARHMCMESRGVQQHGHETTTSQLTGVFRHQPETRAEFMELAR